MALTENAAAALGLTAIAGLSTLNPSSFILQSFIGILPIKKRAIFLRIKLRANLKSERITGRIRISEPDSKKIGTERKSSAQYISKRKIKLKPKLFRFFTF